MPAVESHFGLPLRRGPRPEGGYANHVFRVDSDDGQLALRVSHPPVDADDLAWERGVLRRLVERVPEVTAPLVAPGASTFVLHRGRAATREAAFRALAGC